MDQDQSAALELHQKARTELSINPLTWDTNLSNDAQRYANQLASADDGLDHDNNQKTQGENLAYCSGSWTNPLTESAGLWYAEKEDWTGDDDVAQIQGKEGVGHYTQMIWSTTTHVGMAFAVSSSGALYVVARYSPPGNVLGESPLQETTKPGRRRGRRNNALADASSPYGHQQAMSTPYGNLQQNDSRYGQQRPCGSQSRYAAGRRPCGGNTAASNNDKYEGSSPPSSNPQHNHSPYGQQTHRRPGPSYHSRRAYEETFGDKEGPLPSPPYSRPRLTVPDDFGNQHVYQVYTGPSPFFSRPLQPPGRRMPVSHADARATPYGSSYSGGSGPYGVGGGGSYASAVPQGGYGGYHSSRGSKSLCCAVM